MMYDFDITRPDGQFHVLLIQNKNDKTWTFVNMTKQHICPCRFKTVEDALKDLDHYKDVGKVLHYSYSSSEV